MKAIKGKNGGTLYARQKGDPAPRKGNYKGTPVKGAQKATTRPNTKSK